MSSSSLRFLTASLLFAISGIICGSFAEDTYIGLNLGFLFISLPAFIFGITYLIAHTITIDEVLLKERLLRSTLFVIVGTQISYFVAEVGVVAIQASQPLRFDMFSYLLGSILGAFTIFLFWLMLTQISNKILALTKVLLVACVSFLIMSVFGFRNDYSPWVGFTTWPNSMPIFFVSWQVLVGMTLLHIAKKYGKTRIPNINTQTEESLVNNGSVDNLKS